MRLPPLRPALTAIGGLGLPNASAPFPPCSPTPERRRCVTDNHVALCRAEKAEAERERLGIALTDAESYLGKGLDKMAYNILRAALKGESHE